MIATPPLDAESVDAEKAFVAKKFGIPLSELESILSAPPKSYRDYPNREKLLSLIYATYRRFFSRQAKT